MAIREEFDNSLNIIIKNVYKMSEVVQKALELSIKGLVDQNETFLIDSSSAEEVLDILQKETEELSIKTIALYQPVGKDLRLIVSNILLANDLERIGDLIRNSCKASLELIKLTPLKPYVDIPKMAYICIEMLKKIIKSMLDENYEVALEESKKDDLIDKLYIDIWQELLTYMTKDSKNIEQSNKIIYIAKQLERIGDHITNIAERIYYIKTGNVVDLN
jgi:phosphate transport system protein